jgi:hypothetical protein
LEGERFILLADSAIAVFDQALGELHGRDSLDCLFYLANAHGGRGVMQAKTGNWFSAVKAAFRSRTMLENVTEHDPEYFAAFLGLGVFDYYLSQGLKWLPLFDRSDEGIAAIERASRARFPYDIAAKNVLCWIYMERDRWDEADSVCATVLEQFPQNSVFVKIATCNALWTQRWHDAVEHGRVLIGVARRRSPINWCDLLTDYRKQAEAKGGQRDFSPEPPYRSKTGKGPDVSAPKTASVQSGRKRSLLAYKDQEDEPWHLMSAEALLERTGISPEAGLSQDAVRKNLKEYGPNVLPEPHKRSSLSILAGQFATLPVFLLSAAAGLSVVTGGLLDAAVIMGVVTLNATIGFAT